MPRTSSKAPYAHFTVPIARSWYPVNGIWYPTTWGRAPVMMRTSTCMLTCMCTLHNIKPPSLLRNCTEPPLCAGLIRRWLHLRVRLALGEFSIMFPSSSGVHSLRLRATFAKQPAACFVNLTSVYLLDLGDSALGILPTSSASVIYISVLSSPCWVMILWQRNAGGYIRGSTECVIFQSVDETTT